MGNLKNLSNNTVTDSENLNIKQDEISEYEHLVTLTDNLEENFFSVKVVDGKQKVTYISKACVKIYGYPRESFLVDPNFWFSVIHPDDKDRVSKSTALLGHGEKIIREYRILCKDGTVKWVSNKVIPTLDENGKLIRLDGYTIDIDKRKKAELTLEKYNMVMYQISHDLRGPLNSAKNYISLALERLKDKTAQNYLVKINDSYNKLEGHILSLLDLGRLNRTGAHIEKIELIPFLRNIIGSLEGSEGFDKIKFSTEINTQVDLYSDHIFLQSILYNLINNAIKFRRNITDSAIVINADTDNGKTIIRISDNGLGIPTALQEKAYRMFAKSDNSKGTGLGLYIVKKLVAKLGGEINLESEEMKGTTFTITLPLQSVSEK